MKRNGDDDMGKKKGNNLTFKKVLTMYALLPLIVVSVSIGLAVIIIANTQIKKQIYNSMIASISQIGASFDYSTERNIEIMKAYAQAPAIQNYLKNQDDAELAAVAEQYTLDFFATLEGFEGIYLANWDSKVLTHPAPPVVGKVMREGEKLEELRNAMLDADEVYNVGIISSPASGELIMSLYLPIFDEDKPIGYIGAGTFVNAMADKISDVSQLQLSSAYVYFVSPTGTMLYHPDPEKIGNPVENDAVKLLVADIEAGNHPKPDCVQYNFRGVNKYAAYYVEPDNRYIAVLTADETEALGSVKIIKDTTFTIVVVCVVLFTILSLFVAKVIANPLTEVAKSIDILGTGDITVTCEAVSPINETKSVINGFDSLKDALQKAIGNVKEASSVLNTAIVSVDEKTAYNVESITQINDAIVDVSQTSQTVSQNAQNMAEKSMILEKDVEDLNENIETLLNASQTIKNVNGMATQCMKSVYDGSKDSVQAIHNISEKIAETNAAVENISKAIVAIESIASQTNLLSLNASIEAARAGEAGRGFAVVADEIRTLADSSAQSAKEIRAIIENITALSGETVDISDQVYNVISKEQNDIETTQLKFNELLESVESSISEINKIKTIAVSLDDIKSELTMNISELSAISEQLGASAEEVASSCQIVTEACTDTQASTQEMRAINENMTMAIDFFKL